MVESTAQLPELGMLYRNVLERTLNTTTLSLKVNFKDSTGKLVKAVEANEGDDILSIAHEYDIDLEGMCVRNLPSSILILFRCMRGLCGVFDLPCYSSV